MTRAIEHPDLPRARLVERLLPVQTETLPLAGASGRVLAEAVTADRDSPPYDVSAMDGYAVRLADLQTGTIPVAGEIPMGTDPPELPKGCALRIMTGACVPAEAEAIVVREDTDERDDAVVLRVPPSEIRLGQHIRRRGENLAEGGEVLPTGTPIGPQVAAALAAFGCARPRVHRRVRAAVVVTGDELLAVDASPLPWQIRDSNGPALRALLDRLPWVETVSVIHARDDRELLAVRIDVALERADVVFVTGGVSMGVYDHVPDAVTACGGDIVFHRLPIRPGKPILGAVGPQGQAILGLPGNPVSVLVGARWFGGAVLRRRAGLPPDPGHARVSLRGLDDKRLGLWWFRPVRHVGPNEVELAKSRGSGDLVSAARSDGFILMPPNAEGLGPWPFTPFDGIS